MLTCFTVDARSRITGIVDVEDRRVDRRVAEIVAAGHRGNNVVRKARKRHRRSRRRHRSGRRWGPPTTHGHAGVDGYVDTVRMRRTHLTRHQDHRRASSLPSAFWADSSPASPVLPAESPVLPAYCAACELTVTRSPTLTPRLVGYGLGQGKSRCCPPAGLPCVMVTGSSVRLRRW